MDDSTKTIHNRKLASEFAHAVATPGTRASVIDADNRRIGTCRIQEAVDRDLSFFVTARLDLVVLDLDGPLAVLDVELLDQWLQSRRIQSVITSSGGADRRHLIAIVDDPQIRTELFEIAEDLGVDCRRGSQSIRPPLARHRSGTRSELLKPRNPNKALRRLRRTPKPMSERMTRLLFEGDRQGRYSSRSEQDMAIACEVVRIGGTIDGLESILRTSQSSVGEKLRNASERQASREIERLWAKATGRVTGNDSTRSPKASKKAARARKRLAAVRSAMDASPERWRGIGGANERVLLEELIARGMRIGSNVVDMDVRTAQLLLGAKSTSTPSRVFKRLRSGDDPWIERIKRGHGKEASRWRILNRGAGDGTSSLRGGVNMNCSVECACRDVLDLLTPKQRQVLSLLSDDVPQSTQEVSKQLGTKARTLQVHLANLSLKGLAHRDASGWVRCSVELHDLATHLEVEGARCQLRKHHDSERRDFRRRFGIENEEQEDSDLIADR